MHHPNLEKYESEPVALEQLITEEVFAILDAHGYTKNHLHTALQDSRFLTQPLAVTTANGNTLHMRVKQLDQMRIASADDIEDNQPVLYYRAESPTSIALLVEFQSTALSYVHEPSWEQYVACFITWEDAEEQPSFSVLSAKNGNELPFDDLYTTYDVMRGIRAQLTKKMLVGFASSILEDDSLLFDDNES